LAKPNYSFEKRQRELAKKRKKEEKAQRKSAGPGEPAADEPATGEPLNSEPSPAPTPAP
jgi:hypothetical protein